MKSIGKRLLAILLFLSFTLLYSYDPEHTKLKNVKPSELEGVEFENKLGNQIPLDINFKNESGDDTSLGVYFKQGKPIVLSMVYFRCPTLCNYHLNGIAKVFRELDWNLGDKYEFIAISIDPTENSDLALAKKNAYLDDYMENGKFRVKSGMHFLTGTEANIKPLAASLGFRYKYIPGNKQYVHPSVAYILTPEGRISRIFNGISFEERDLKLSLVEATGGKIGTMMERVALFCFQFDPNKNKYTIYAYNLMRIGGAVTAFFVAGYLITFWRRNKNLT